MIRICDAPAACPEEQKSFCISEDLFSAVRDYVQKHHIEDGRCFPVMDDAGKILFYAQYTENLVLGKKRNDFLDYKKRFNDISGLDFTLLDQYQTFVFTEAEEYSVAIAQLLQKFCPEKRCVFLDKRARYFVGGENVRFFPFHGVAGRYMQILKKWLQGKSREIGLADRVICLILYRIIKRRETGGGVCIIATEKDFYWPVNIIYNSVKVMYSILWCKCVKSLGDKNENKTIVILDYPCFNEGLVSIMRWTYTHTKWLRERGYIPVVDLHTFPNQYLNAESENMWEYFFEPVSEISVEEAYESRKVISAVDNQIIMGESKVNPYQEKWSKQSWYGKDFNHVVKLNGETKQRIAEGIPQEFKQGRRILGVVMRGTAYRKEVAQKWHKEWRQDIVDADVFLQACNYYKDELKCEYIFLATEDAEYFEMARKIFGSELLFIDQKRTAYDFANREYLAMNQVLGMNDGREAGFNYLTILKSLSECDALLFNVACGAVNLAQCWNDGKYEMIRHIDSAWKPEIGQTKAVAEP